MSFGITESFKLTLCFIFFIFVYCVCSVSVWVYDMYVLFVSLHLYVMFVSPLWQEMHRRAGFEDHDSEHPSNADFSTHPSQYHSDSDSEQFHMDDHSK